MKKNFKRCNWGNPNLFVKDISRILLVRMIGKEGAEKEILQAIWNSLNDNSEYDHKQQHKSNFHKSHGTYGSTSGDSYGREQHGFGYNREGFHKSQRSHGSHSGDSNHGYRREQYGSKSNNKDDFYYKSHGTYGSKTGDSNYGSGYKDEGSSKSKPEKEISSQDNYAILGVGKNASLSEIKKSYYKMAKEHHPGRQTNTRSVNFLTVFFFR